jgi:3-methylfumaryl-CoA hydratase
MGPWDAWIGRTERRFDQVDAARLAKWLATFDRDPPADGTAPQGFHWCLCTPDEPTAMLGPDGHPRRDGDEANFLPPVPLPRRMWASSAVEFHHPLRVGDRIERHSRVASIAAKQGGSGDLVFVEVEHKVRTETALSVRERQSIVYRSPASAERPPTKSAPTSLPSAQRVVRPSEALLFRYSALTFNSHRIHYDVPYTTDEEGYAGLVVQGPLTATLLLDLARREFGDQALTRFSFRGMSPAIAGDALSLTLTRADDEVTFAAAGPDGRLVMSATGTLVPRGGSRA